VPAYPGCPGKEAIKWVSVSLIVETRKSKNFVHVFCCVLTGWCAVVFTGSVLAVVSADPHSPDKTNRFVGICVQRAEYGLRANFTLRNVIDGQGMV